MATQFNEAENPHWRKTFFPIWIGQAFSLIGSRLVGFALIWYLTESTGSAIVLTTVSIVGMLPEMVLAPFAGALVDRWNRQKVMIIADSGIALVTLFLGLLFALGIVEIWHIYVLMFARSIGGAFHYPAMSASTSLMVPKEKLTKIQGLNQILSGALAIIAAPLGALAIEILSIGNVLFIDVITAAIAIIPLFFVTIPQPNVVTTAEQKASPIKTMLKDVAEGMKYVYHWKGLFYILLLATGINAIINPAFSLLPLLVNKTFGLGAPALASIETTLGIGMILGSLILSTWGGFKKKVMTSTAALSIWVIGLLFIAFAPVDKFWMLIFGMAIGGITNPIVNGPINAIFQEGVDPSMQGRVFSLIGTMATAITPLGLLIAGPVSEVFGVQSWFFIATVYIVFMCVVILSVPAIRNIEEGNPNKANSTTPAGFESVSVSGD
jgi:DHA3 family macrolide efflux protein-like MFS transporter